MRGMHVAIDPIKCQVAEKFLYDMDVSKRSWVDAKIIGLSSYKGSCLTFHINVKESGAIFSYIPPHALRKKDHPGQMFGYRELDYHFCQDDDMVVFELPFLMDRELSVFLRVDDKLKKIAAKYIKTIDWPYANIQQHLVTLSNGQFAVVPNHKLLTGKSDSLPAYKKLRQDWT